MFQIYLRFDLLSGNTVLTSVKCIIDHGNWNIVNTLPEKFMPSQHKHYGLI